MPGGANPDRLAVRRGPAPEPPGEDWCLVEVTMAGVCGSDLTGVRVQDTDPNAPGAPLGELPAVGHEVVGTVAVPARVGGPRTGARVAVHPLVTCTARGTEPCADCRHGWYGQCRSFWEPGALWGKSLGFSTRLGGGWGDAVAVHRSMIRPLPDSLPDRTAVLAEPLSVALSGLRAVCSMPGDTVAVVGGGTLGLLTALALQTVFPDRRRLLLARHAFQARVAGRLGPDTVEPMVGGAAVAAARLGLDWTDLGGTDLVRGGPSLVVDAAGTSDSLTEALALVDFGGTVLTLGNPEECCDLRALWLKRVTLVGHLEHASLPAAWTGETDSMAAALRLLAGRPGLGDLLVTHTFPPESLPRALEVARDRSRHHAVKVALARALPNDTTVTR
ncbi:alcohol dehydrogenase catalytic domain-containing protein [Streptomyces violaceoruber]|uniref:alcohol dehydrogenase catalytic domain-containing protein n=1 Tax=Streptomyces violaceoruber TaxID=1935 RepID=UPI001F3DD957|nr:alcohol dehydrogenase catalytic domain-containing protein [Streptomyces violaceoruber]MCF3165798.1 alcohol dehydrogenase catalytic domain-containing protein [Streptomyces violaceoruber]